MSVTNVFWAWSGASRQTCSVRTESGAGDLLEEGHEPLVAVAWAPCDGDLAGGELQGREQGEGAVSDVVVAAAFSESGLERQDQCGPLQGLDLGYLVDTELISLVISLAEMT